MSQKAFPVSFLGLGMGSEAFVPYENFENKKSPGGALGLTGPEWHSQRRFRCSNVWDLSILMVMLIRKCDRMTQ